MNPERPGRFGDGAALQGGEHECSPVVRFHPGLHGRDAPVEDLQVECMIEPGEEVFASLLTGEEFQHVCIARAAAGLTTSLAVVIAQGMFDDDPQPARGTFSMDHTRMCGGL